MKLLKNRLFLAGMMIFILIAMAAPVFAADHNYQYEFHLQVGGKNSYLSSSESKYRQTTNTSNLTLIMYMPEQVHIIIMREAQQIKLR